MILQPLAAAGDLFEPEECECAIGTRNASAGEAQTERARELDQRRDAARVVVRSRLLDVSDDHDSLVRYDTTGNLGNKRSDRPRRERAGDGHTHLHGRIRTAAADGWWASKRPSQRRIRTAAANGWWASK